MIVLPLRFFCPRLLGSFARLQILRLKVKYFHAKLSSSRSLSTPQLRGLFRSSCCFYLKSNLQLLGQWSAGLNLAKIKNTDNHFGTDGVACLKGSIGTLLIQRAEQHVNIEKNANHMLNKHECQINTENPRQSCPNTFPMHPCTSQISQHGERGQPCQEEVYGRLTRVLASREATSFFHIVVFTSMC